MEFQSTRSQDRDVMFKVSSLVSDKFQSTRSQDRDFLPACYTSLGNISIHSVARPRQDDDDIIELMIDFNPLGRKTETG